MAFPVVPTVGDQYITTSGIIYEWTADGAWKEIVDGGGAAQPEVGAGAQGNIDLSPPTLRDQKATYINAMSVGVQGALNNTFTLITKFTATNSNLVDSTWKDGALTIGETDSGVWGLSMNIAWSGQSSSSNATILINGADQVGFTTLSAAANAANHPSCSVAATPLNAGDVVTFGGRQVSGGSLKFNKGTNISAVRIGDL